MTFSEFDHDPSQADEAIAEITQLTTTASTRLPQGLARVSILVQVRLVL